MRKNNFKVVALLSFLIVVLVFLGYLVLCDMGKTKAINKELGDQIARQIKENAERNEFNDTLRNDVVVLQDPIEALKIFEEIARESYGLIKADEIKFYMSQDVQDLPDIQGLDELIQQEIPYKFDNKAESRKKIPQ